LVVVTAALPPTADPDVWSGLGWERVLANVYDPLFHYKLRTPEELGLTVTGIDALSDLRSPMDEAVNGVFFNKWEISPDNKTFTLHVDPNLKSARGNPATADAFVWREQRGYAIPSSIQSFLVGVMGSRDVSDITKIDDMTIQIYAPNGSGAILFKVLTLIENMALDVKALKDDGCLTEEDPWGMKCLDHKSYGFGPYNITEFTPGNQILMEANPYYPRPLQFKNIVYREIPESGNRLAMLIAGQAHLSSEQTLVEVKSVTGGNGEATYAGMNVGSKWLAVLMTRSDPAWTNDDCVRGMGYAIPYAEIQEVAFEGTGTTAHEDVCPLYGENVNSEAWPYSLDTAKASELWKAGGCPAQFTLSWDSSISEMQDVGTMIKSQFAKFGVDAVLNPLPSGTYAQMENRFTLGAFLEEQSAFVPDVGYAVWLAYHKTSIGNFNRFMDDEVTAKIDQAMLLTDGPERKRLLFEVQQAVVDRGGRQVILWTPYTIVANKHLAGLTWYPDSLPRYRDLKWVP
jgi:peptide/nickel transport system substrate-binding protein